jgi:hypothetical protein
MPTSTFAIGGRSLNRETDFPGRLEIGRVNVGYRHVRGELDGCRDELWIEVRLDADWAAAFLVEPVDGSPEIAEARVLPYEDDPERTAVLGPAEWRRGQTPPGEIPLEKLKSVRPEDILRVARESLEDLPDDAEYLNEVLAEFGFGATG